MKLGDDGSVVGIVEKQNSGPGIVNSGVYMMPKEFFDHYEELRALSSETEEYLTYAIEILTKHNVKFKLAKLNDWYGINAREQLLAINKKLGKLNTARINKIPK